jgi:O-6-methylguanine DNA methyltransferase
VGQQVSVAGAATLLARLADAFGASIDDALPEGLARRFPTAADIARCDADALRGIGLTGARARTLIALARAVEDGAVSLRPGADVERVEAALARIRGIGPWTASYVARRSRRAARARRDTCGASAGAQRSVAPVARVCGHAPLATARRGRRRRIETTRRLTMKDMRTNDTRSETPAARASGGAMPMRTAALAHRMETPLGEIVLVADAHGDALQGVYFAQQKHFPADAATWHEARRVPLLATVEAELREYFAGRRTTFDLPLAPAGTPFQRRVWQAIAEIPFGATISYAELARRIGKPSAVRAAAAATGRNPLTIVIPCHRIVGSDGRMTGYAGGLARKRALLDLEAGAGDAAARKVA